MDMQPQLLAPDSGHYEVASDRGGERAAVMYTLIQTARLNDVDPQAWLADVLARINDHKIQKLDELLPWNWKTNSANLAA
jgi:transposase